MGSDQEDPVRTEYDGLAARYDRIWSHYIQASTRETLKRLRPRPGDRVLDVGCGTGAFLATLISGHDDLEIAGVDLSDRMLTVARGKLGSEPDLRHGDAEDLPHDDSVFDIVTSVSMFHYLRHPPVALREARRVLRPGGRIVITDWCHDYLSCRFLDLLLRLFNRAHFRTYGEQELERLMTEAGFEDIRLESYKIDAMWGMMTGTGRKPG
jgi:ubiquinone/menaquinone biosynthesis C-methylase UbiE